MDKVGSEPHHSRILGALVPLAALWAMLWTMLAVVESAAYIHDPDVPRWQPITLVGVLTGTLAVWLTVELRSARYRAVALDPPRPWFVHQLRRLPMLAVGYGVVVIGLRHAIFSLAGAHYFHIPWRGFIPFELVKVTLFYCLWLGLVYVTGGLRVALQSQDERFAVAAISAIERSLESAGIKVAGVTTGAQLGRALGGHLFMLIAILTFMAMLMAIVGLLGLGSALGTSVLERAREFGVMRAIGAGDRSICTVVLAEGLLIGVMSVGLAAVASVPLTLVAARLVGAASLGPAQSTIVSAYAIPLCLAVVLAGAAAASLGAVRKALRVTVREALAYP